MWVEYLSSDVQLLQPIKGELHYYFLEKFNPCNCEYAIVIFINFTKYVASDPPTNAILLVALIRTNGYEPIFLTVIRWIASYEYLIVSP